jgi:hypothetical protein
MTRRTATRLSKHDLLFVLWFLRAFVTERDEHAAAALCGGSRDATALEETTIPSAFIIFDARDRGQRMSGYHCKTIWRHNIF